MRVLHVVGFSGSGKTRLILALLGLADEGGLRLGVVKHHAGLLSQPRKDSSRFYAEGAATVLVADDGLLEMADHPRLERALGRLPQDLDLVLVEGFKRREGPKVWVGDGCPADDRDVLAVVGGVAPKGIPSIPRGDARAVFDQVVRPLLGARAT